MMCPLRAKEFTTNMSDQGCQPDCAWLVDVFKLKFDGYGYRDHIGRMCCEAAKALNLEKYDIRPVGGKQ